MSRITRFLQLLIFIVLLAAVCVGFTTYHCQKDERFVSYTCAPENITMHFRDNDGNRIGNLKNLKNIYQNKGEKLLFAMNGGMYNPERTPLGLYIENGKTVSEINTKGGEGNFYMKPNGIFYVDTNHKAFVTTTQAYKGNDGTKYATQSGPMLVIDGNIHPQFKQGSKNTNIRNGVGILPDGRVILAMSKKKINFYDFAVYFKELGCKNALYLDGLVSRTYAPSESWIQEGGRFGVIIGVSEKNN
ncbi:MAG TPA: phosphodiester glycosidase family protein [Flavobacterium sp.]|nr:phosphodiester glycosidase family protein [Flavobacterium sp.]